MSHSFPALIITDPRRVTSALNESITASLALHALVMGGSQSTATDCDALASSCVTGDDYW
jgi:hypothetical protein